MCTAAAEQYLLNHFQLNAMSARFKAFVPRWCLSSHHDGSAGMLVLAYQLVGSRDLYIHQVDGPPLVIKCYPGHV